MSGGYEGNYDEQHVACPRCGSVDIEQTCVGFDGRDSPTFRDENRASCRCKWRGTVHDLVSKAKAEQIKHERGA